MLQTHTNVATTQNRAFSVVFNVVLQQHEDGGARDAAMYVFVQNWSCGEAILLMAIADSIYARWGNAK